MIRRLGSAALAAVSLAGVVVAIVPQHAASLVLLTAGTLVVVAAAFLLVLAGPLVTADQPTTALDVERAAGAPALEPQGLRDARRDLAGRSAPGSVPAAVRDRLLAAGVDLPPLADTGARTTSDPAAVAVLVGRLLDEPAPLAPPGGHR